MCSRSGRKFVPPGLRRTPGCCLITSGCPPAPAPAPAARVCLPDFLRGQSLTFELPGSRDILSDDLRRRSQRSSARRRASRSHMLLEKRGPFTPGNLSLARQPIKRQLFKAVFIYWISGIVTSLSHIVCIFPTTFFGGHRNMYVHVHVYFLIIYIPLMMIVVHIIPKPLLLFLSASLVQIMKRYLVSNA